SGQSPARKSHCRLSSRLASLLRGGENPPMKPSGKIRFLCPHCGKAVGVSAQHAGKRGRCPGCGTVIRTPAAETLAPARETAAVEESRPRGPSLPLDLARRGWKPYRFKDS